MRKTVVTKALGLTWLIAATLGAGGPVTPQPEDARRHVTVTIRRAGFEPARVEVRQNDLVQITLVAEDSPHAFAIDAYRIARRSTPGHPSTFEFRADQAGSFAFYCSLAAADGRTHDERGELVVRR